MSELPEGWITCRLKDAIEDIQAGFASGKKDVEGGLSHLRMNNISVDGKLNLELLRTVPQSLASHNHYLKGGDVLICTTNSGKLVGKCALFDLEGHFAFSNHLTRLRVNPNTLESKYLLHQLWLLWKKGDFEHKCKHWVNQSTLPKEELLSSEILLAPLNEQRRIVAKLEKLLSRVDAAQTRLATIPRILKRFRQSVLAAACSGRLTANWRETNTDVEPAPKFLKRIQAERRALWERVELRKINARGFSPKDDKWKEKYKEPNDTEDKELNGLPPLWKWERLDSVLAYIEAGKSFSCTERPPLDNEVGVLKVSAVTWGEFDDSESKTCNDSKLVNPDIQVRVGDFLFSRANTIELVGACVIVKKISSNVMLSDKTLRLHVAGMLQEYVLYTLRSSIGRAEIERLATGNQNSMRNIGQDRMRDILFPVPPFAEQQEIVRRVEALFKTADALEARYRTAKVHIDKLTQPILAKAFRGELVPQDPNDEPASVLLERIRRSRNGTSSTGK